VHRFRHRGSVSDSVGATLDAGDGALRWAHVHRDAGPRIPDTGSRTPGAGGSGSDCGQVQ